MPHPRFGRFQELADAFPWQAVEPGHVHHERCEFMDGSEAEFWLPAGSSNQEGYWLGWIGFGPRTNNRYDTHYRRKNYSLEVQFGSRADMRAGLVMALAVWNLHGENRGKDDG